MDAPSDITRAVIQQNLPDDDQSLNSAVSHSNIGGLDACGRSGHATGTSIDSYLDKTFIVKGLCGGKAPVGFTDIDTGVIRSRDLSA
jgi:hypothetical protein